MRNRKEENGEMEMTQGHKWQIVNRTAECTCCAKRGQACSLVRITFLSSEESSYILTKYVHTLQFF